LVKDIKEKQQTEAEHNLSALRKSRELAAQRYRQYQHLLGKPQIQIPGEQDVAALDVSRLNPASSAQATGDVSGLALTSPELDHLSFLNSANTFSIIAGGFNTAGGIAHVVPDFQIGAGAPPPAVHWGVRPQLDRDFFQHTVQRRQFSRQPQCNQRRS
jgi:hypothetical protein